MAESEKKIMRILLIIDLQEQFHDKEGDFERIRDWCENHRDEYDIILPTFFKNNTYFNPKFVQNLHWDGCSSASAADLAVTSKGIKQGYAEKKHGYASKDIFKIATRKDEIDVVGCDSDACVMATAFGLWDKGYNFRVLSKYVYTTGEVDNDTVIKVMRRNFGDCVV
jgi:hypothetical protein